MDVFALREKVVSDYRHYIESFVRINDEDIAEFVEKKFNEGVLWPDAILQLNPAYQPGSTLDELAAQGGMYWTDPDVVKYHVNFVLDVAAVTTAGNVVGLTKGLTVNVEMLSLMNPPFLLGLILGGSVIFWFSGAATQAVATGAFRAVEFIKENIKLDATAVKA